MISVQKRAFFIEDKTVIPHTHKKWSLKQNRWKIYTCIVPFKIIFWNTKKNFKPRLLSINMIGKKNIKQTAFYFLPHINQTGLFTDRFLQLSSSIWIYFFNNLKSEMNSLKNIFLTTNFYLFYTNVLRAKAHINIWWSSW